MRRTAVRRRAGRRRRGEPVRRRLTASPRKNRYRALRLLRMPSARHNRMHAKYVLCPAVWRKAVRGPRPLDFRVIKKHPSGALGKRSDLQKKRREPNGHCVERGGQRPRAAIRNGARYCFREAAGASHAQNELRRDWQICRKAHDKRKNTKSILAAIPQGLPQHGYDCVLMHGSKDQPLKQRLRRRCCLVDQPLPRRVWMDAVRAEERVEAGTAHEGAADIDQPRAARVRG